ncbi:MAG: NADH-quinone oxidoreductase subunit NuoF [bacterium]|nr:MAG: NADH-quinone oxidoreductase subunit NuoF [bacterium]
MAVSNNGKSKIIVGMASCGIAAGAQEVFDSLAKHIAEMKLDVELTKTGCIGACYREPLIEIKTAQIPSVIYGDMTVKRVKQLLEQHLVNGQIISEWAVVGEGIQTSEQDLFENQRRIVLRNAGEINPENIHDYVERDGYKAIQKVLKDFKAEDVIAEIKNSGIRGRGGAGFSTGLKWQFARQSESNEKYIICNGDEGDPGAFMDRSIMEGDPHSVLEGMLIAGYAIGAQQGIIYVRAEYPLAVHRLEIAIQQARERGFLGKKILGSKFSFNIILKLGAGAFVCGEETALIASVEGKRGMPRLRPPFPAVRGLWDKPTNINNVETYANIPWIILKGAKEFASLGTEKSKGTKVFALAGKIKRGGMVEVPMGMSLRDVIYKIGGGIKDDKEFKAVQLGGPSGGCVPESLLDTPVDYDSLTKTGAIMGSGGMVVMDDRTCMVDVSKFFLKFTQEESCGKCTFCRIGTKRMLEILERITEGKGQPEDIEKLESLAEYIKQGSLCGLGQTAPNPVLTTIQYFREEYEAHIHQKKCPAKSCRELIEYRVIPDNCTGCMLCARVCPVDAISGAKKEIHYIDPEICTHCGACYDACKFDAIDILTGVLEDEAKTA